ncbi:MAG TPA: glycine cleavage system protein H [Bacteroidota bacterium]|jgi:glycine cleavage system H lipoate-binding protein|nr:glycine cleavage system protein H [Bacteroidota bacterium]
MTVLFVLATILLFLGADWILQRWRAAHAAQPQPYRIPPAHPLRIPKGIFFTPSHTWLHLFPSGKVEVGVDDFISQLMKSPEIILLKELHEHIEKDEPMMLLKTGDHLLTVRSPISGKVLSVNHALPGDPSLLKEQPFSDGWGYIIEPASQTDIKQMFVGSETRAWIRDEVQRLRDILAGATGPELQPLMMQDGGLPVEGALDSMPSETWQKIDQEFLQPH